MRRCKYCEQEIPLVPKEVVVNSLSDDEVYHARCRVMGKKIDELEQEIETLKEFMKRIASALQWGVED